MELWVINNGLLDGIYMPGKDVKIYHQFGNYFITMNILKEIRITIFKHCFSIENDTHRVKALTNLCYTTYILKG